MNHISIGISGCYFAVLLKRTENVNMFPRGHTKTRNTRKTRHTRRRTDKNTPYENEHYMLHLFMHFQIEKHVI